MNAITTKVHDYTHIMSFNFMFFPVDCNYTKYFSIFGQPTEFKAAIQ